MSQELKKVTPGDVIIASQWNLMIDIVQSLDVRVLKLESAVPSDGALIITELTPPGDVLMGSILQIKGKNFGLTTLVTVLIEGNPQAIQPGSGDELLIIEVGAIGNLPADGIVNLVVSKPGSFATRKIKVVSPPTTVLTGQLTLGAPTPPLTAPASPGNPIFEFPFSALTTMAAEYTITPTVTLPAGNAAGWSADIVNDAGASISRKIPVPQSPPGSPFTTKIRVQVTIPANVQANTDFQVSLEIRSGTNPPLIGSRFGQFQIGAVAPPPSTKIKLALGDVFPLAANSPNGLQVKPDNTKRVTAHFIVTLEDVGDYTILAPSVLGDPNNRFTATLKTEPNFTTNVPNQTLPGDAVVDVRGSSGLNADAILVMKVAKKNDPNVSGEIQHPIQIRP
jgi:hypothetical protein